MEWQERHRATRGGRHLAAHDPIAGPRRARALRIRKTGGNQTTIERLHRDGHVVADLETATGRRIVDPLELWLANERRWPEVGDLRGRRS